MFSFPCMDSVKSITSERTQHEIQGLVLSYTLLSNENKAILTLMLGWGIGGHHFAKCNQQLSPKAL